MKKDEPRTRANFTLATATHAILAASGNASRYIDEAVRLRDRRWRRALPIAREELTPAQLREVVASPDALGKVPARCRRAVRVLVRELDAGNDALAVLLKLRDEPAAGWSVRGVVRRRG